MIAGKPTGSATFGVARLGIPELRLADGPMGVHWWCDAATAYPAMIWLVHAPTFGKLLAVELWLSFLYGSYNGAMVVFLTEIMPVEVRTAGFSLAYSLATAIFGGFTPAISTWLIELTGNRAVPGLWLSFAAICGLSAALVARPHCSVTVAHEPELDLSQRPAFVPQQQLSD